ncbi:MAG: 30S ribosomal protein S7 [Promethearchaeota archaeon]
MAKKEQAEPESEPENAAKVEEKRELAALSRRETPLVEEVLLFGRWSWEGLEVHDVGLQRYINLTPRIIPHTGGRHEHKRFWKSQISIVERFVNKILSPGLIGRKVKGRGASNHMGKKAKVLEIVEEAFALVELRTGQNPIQVLINAIENSAPREETTRITLGGISYPQAVDIAPQRRVDLAIKNLVQAAIGSTYNSAKSIEECFADELIAAANNDLTKSKAIARKDEIERIAVSAR